MRKQSVRNIRENANKLMNEVVLGTAGVMDDAHIVYKLDERLKERGLSQKQLAQMTGLRVGTVSNWVSGKQGVNINFVQLFAIMVALRITDMSEVFEIRVPEDMGRKFEDQQHEWISDREMPIELKEMYRANVLKSANLDL